MLPHYLLLALFLTRCLIYSYIYSSVCKVSFISQDALKVSCSSLLLTILNMMWLVVFFTFLVLGVYWASWICSFTVFIKFENFWPLIFQIYFLSFLILYRLWLHMYETTQRCPTTHWCSVHFYCQPFFSLRLFAVSIAFL